MSKTTQPKPQDHSTNWRSVLPGVLLAILVVLVYFPAFRGEFLWDDDSNIIDSRPLRTLGGLGQIWFEPAATQQYYPLTHSSFWLDYHLWGLHPYGYHVENVLLHAFSAVLLWRLLRRLAVPGAWLGAALFALHPVNVESVAWITERKNTLSGVFFLGSLLAAAKFWRLDQPDKAAAAPGHGEWRFYWLALALYVCALWSKTATVGLPVVLGLLFWWKRGWPARKHLLLLTPFLAAGVALGLMTMWVEQHHLGVTEQVWGGLSRLERTLIAGRALWFYLGKLVWPYPLMFIYPRWSPQAGTPVAYLLILAILAGFYLLWRKRETWGRPSLVAAACFVVMLFPILGFFNGAFFLYSFVSDHFQYLAQIGPLTLAAAGITIFTGRWAQKAPWLQTAVCSALLLTAALLSWRQIPVYRNVEMLWRDALAHNPDSWMAHDNLGNYLSSTRQFEEAASEYRRSLELNPQDHRALNNLGLDAARQGRLEEAIAYFNQALEIFPNYAMGHYNLGRILSGAGRFDEGMQQLELAVRIEPKHALAYFTMGNILERKGDVNAAMQQYRRAVELEPALAAAHASLGRVLAGQGRTDEAIAHYQLALESDPRSVEALANLANALVTRNRLDDAVACYQRALEINPNSPVLHYDLGVAFDRQGKRAESQAELAEARRLQAAIPAPEMPASR